MAAKPPASTTKSVPKADGTAAQMRRAVRAAEKNPVANARLAGMRINGSSFLLDKPQQGGWVYKDGTADPGVASNGWRIMGYPRAVRTLDMVNMWLAFVAFLVYVIVLITQKTSGDLVEYSSGFVWGLFITLPMLVSISVVRFCFPGVDWTTQLMLAGFGWFVGYGMMVAVYAWMLPAQGSPEEYNTGFDGPSESQEAQAESDKQADTPQACRLYTIEALRRDTIYKGFLQAARDEDYPKLRRYKMAISRWYHPDRCVRQGCVAECTKTFEYYRQQAEALNIDWAKTAASKN